MWSERVLHRTQMIPLGRPNGADRFNLSLRAQRSSLLCGRLRLLRRGAPRNNINVIRPAPGGSGKRQLADGFANAMDHRQAPKRVPNRDVSRLGAQTPLKIRQMENDLNYVKPCSGPHWRKCGRLTVFSSSSGAPEAHEWLLLPLPPGAPGRPAVETETCRTGRVAVYTQ
jgi:hypothetical protein